MTQVICPGCAKLIEVGVLPPGTLPSCPFCRTVFQLAKASPEAPAPGPPTRQGGRTARNLDPGIPGGPAPSASPPDPSPSEDVATTPWRRTSLNLVIVLLAGCLLAMVLLLAIALLAHREKQRDNPQDAAAATGATWQTIGKHSGHTHRQTPQFRIDSPVWRITWACTADETPAKKTFQVRVMDDRGKLVSTPVNSEGDGGQSTQIETEPGMYFLVIRASNVEWELTIEDQR